MTHLLIRGWVWALGPSAVSLIALRGQRLNRGTAACRFGLLVLDRATARGPVLRRDPDAHDCRCDVGLIEDKACGNLLLDLVSQILLDEPSVLSEGIW